MKALRISGLIFIFTICISMVAAAQENALVHHVSGRVPVTGVGRELAAERPFVAPAAGAEVKTRPDGNTWTELATLNFAVVHDISFATPLIGYAAAEAGEVWKTTDGGKTWTEVLNLSYPYYFYGVHALNAKTVVISGFYDSQTFEGLIRWSHDGGKTWSSDIDLSSTGWVQRVRFQKKNGLIMDLIGGQENTAQYTTDGGAGASDWSTVISDPDGGWFQLEFSFLPNLHARATGIDFCQSLNAGAQWSCGPAVDQVFDGEVFFLNNDKNGWDAGGEISPNVEGWVHVTTNGGNTWSGRTLDGPWPIREVLFLNAKTGWAAGGNIYTGVGGIYFSNDGGNTWTLDVNTGAEMDACDTKPVKGSHQVWCVGYDSSFNAHVYTTSVK
jgi:photosystem II stability/assembly factor-like uncharacterized protein